MSDAAPVGKDSPTQRNIPAANPIKTAIFIRLYDFIVITDN
jgi:hypothetical protein